MVTDFNLLSRKKHELDDIFALINKPSYPTDYNRYYFLSTELDTLFRVISLTEIRAYKKSFILLRTVLEKFLFFWLMLEGTTYRWTITYNIIPNKSKTATEARDKTLQLWNCELVLGDVNAVLY
jgi:hypothetical protein